MRVSDDVKGAIAVGGISFAAVGTLKATGYCLLCVLTAQKFHADLALDVEERTRNGAERVVRSGLAHRLTSEAMPLTSMIYARKGLWVSSEE